MWVKERERDFMQLWCAGWVGWKFGCLSFPEYLFKLVDLLVGMAAVFVTPGLQRWGKSASCLPVCTHCVVDGDAWFLKHSYVPFCHQWKEWVDRCGTGNNFLVQEFGIMHIWFVRWKMASSRPFSYIETVKDGDWWTKAYLLPYWWRYICTVKDGECWTKVCLSVALLMALQVNKCPVKTKLAIKVLRK